MRSIKRFALATSALCAAIPPAVAQEPPLRPVLGIRLQGSGVDLTLSPAGAAGPGFSLGTFAGETIDLLAMGPQGAVVDRTGAADTSAAWIAAIELENARIAAGRSTCIRAPAGTYRIVSALPAFDGPGCILGGGRWNTVIKVDPAYRGDVFAWSEAWLGANGAFPFNGNTAKLPDQRPGPVLRGLAVVGTRAAPALQHAIAFRDHVDLASVSEVDVWYMHGHAFYTGATLNAASAYTRESDIHLRAFNSGAPGAAVMDISTSGSGGDGSNEIRIAADIYAPYDRGLWIHGPYTRLISSDHLRIEGMENNPAGVKADLLTIGDPAMPGTNSDIHLRGLELLNPYAGYAAARVTGTSGRALYGIALDGFVGGGTPAGKGLVIESGHDSRYHFSRIGTSDTNLTITATAGGNNVFDGDGSERTWTTSISSANGLGALFPLFNRAPLTGGIDLQTARQAPAQTASGAGSIAAGENNSASRPGAVALGLGNIADALGSFVSGVGGTARGRPFWRGRGTDIGMQDGSLPVSATTSGAREVSLRTSGGGCPTIPDNTVFGIRVSMAARDVSHPANSFAYATSGVLSRASGSSTTIYAGAAGTPSGIGTGVRAGARIAQDTAGDCLYVGFRPPAGDTDTWHVGATVEAVEVP